MTLFTHIRNSLTATLLMAGSVAIMLSGCQKSDEPYAGGQIDVPMSISVSRTESSPALGNELINSWWVVFTQTDGTVAAIADGTPASPVEHDEIRLQLSPGTYKAYAFANVSAEALKKATGLTFSKDVKVDDDAIKSAVWQNLSNLYSGHIPRTGTATVTVTDRIHEPFAVEVVRMYAKIEVEFTSEATEAVTVNSIDFLPMCEGPVKLMPDYNIDNAPALLAGATIGKTVAQTNINLTVPANSKTGKKTSHIYVREVSAMSATDLKSLNLLLHTTRGGEAQILRAIVDGVSFINRNDHILIPILFTDWTIDPQVIFYPPIGGYPEASLNGKDDDFYVEFGTQGDFAINMRVRRAKASEAYLPASQVEVTILDGIEDPSGIFTKLPSLNPLTGEIIGTLSENRGTAKVKVSIKIAPDNKSESFPTDPTKVKYEYLRTLYITRK